MQKYFISKSDLENKVITGEDVFHIKNVMRGRPGDMAVVCDEDHSYAIRLSKLSDKEISFDIIDEIIGNHELPVFVSIFQGYPKGDKMEDIIKHGTELGAYEFIPTLMKRSVFKLDVKKKSAKLVRFNKIAKEAAEQSNRDRIPRVIDIQSLRDIDFSSFDIKIVCYEEVAKKEESVEFKNAIKSLNPGNKIAIVIGPEGGIEESEIDYLKSQGFKAVSLGKRILRTETVVFYCLSAIGYELELK